MRKGFVLVGLLSATAATLAAPWLGISSPGWSASKTVLPSTATISAAR